MSWTGLFGRAAARFSSESPEYVDAGASCRPAGWRAAPYHARPQAALRVALPRRITSWHRILTNIPSRHAQTVSAYSGNHNKRVLDRLEETSAEGGNRYIHIIDYNYIIVYYNMRCYKLMYIFLCYSIVHHIELLAKADPVVRPDLHALRVDGPAAKIHFFFFLRSTPHAVYWSHLRVPNRRCSRCIRGPGSTNDHQHPVKEGHSCGQNT